MISVEVCRSILGDNYAVYTDEEISELIELLYEFAIIEHDALKLAYKNNKMV